MGPGDFPRPRLPCTQRCVVLASASLALVVKEAVRVGIVGRGRKGDNGQVRTGPCPCARPLCGRCSSSCACRGCPGGYLCPAWLLNTSAGLLSWRLSTRCTEKPADIGGLPSWRHC